MRTDQPPPPPLPDDTALAAYIEASLALQGIALTSVWREPVIGNFKAIAGAARLDDPARTELAELEARAFASRDLQEGLASFAEKRTPQFTGE